MQYNMRRSRQRLQREHAVEILSNASHGVLSLVDPDGEPYGVPLSFSLDGTEHIYFHCAEKGRKADCIAGEERCSFCVVAEDNVVPEEFTTYFRSVIVRGKIRIVSDPDEILHGLHLLCSKYSPGENAGKEIASCIDSVSVLRLDICAISGKEAIELVRQRTGIQ